VRIL
jgi:hypothetical protein